MRQPAPPNKPIRLKKEHQESLERKLKEWLSEIDHEDKETGKIHLTKKSGHDLKTQINQFLADHFQTFEALSFTHWPHH